MKNIVQIIKEKLTVSYYPTKCMGTIEHYDDVYKCPRCSNGEYVNSSYCSHCGARLMWDYTKMEKS